MLSSARSPQISPFIPCLPSGEVFPLLYTPSEMRLMLPFSVTIAAGSPPQASRQRLMRCHSVAREGSSAPLSRYLAATFSSAVAIYAMRSKSSPSLAMAKAYQSVAVSVPASAMSLSSSRKSREPFADFSYSMIPFAMPRISSHEGIFFAQREAGRSMAAKVAAKIMANMRRAIFFMPFITSYFKISYI